MGVNGHWYIEQEKQAYWRGINKSFVNRYVMSGAQPTAAEAITVINALAVIEDAIFPQTAAGEGVGRVQGRAYPSGKGSFFASVNWNTSLEPATALGFTGPTWTPHYISWAPTLETCLLCETPINGLSSTGKPVSLRKYFRGINSGTSEDSGPGVINPADVTGIEGVIAPWWTGMGANNWVVIANSGNQASSAPTVHPFLVAHQVPRGRKKKASSSSILTTLAGIAQHVAESGVGNLIVDGLEDL